MSYESKLKVMSDNELLEETKDVIEGSVIEFLDEDNEVHWKKTLCEQESSVRDGDIFGDAEDYIHRAFTIF